MNIKRALKSLSIKRKIILLILVVAGLIESLLFTTFMIIRINDYKTDMLNNSVLNTQLIGENVITSLTFEDKTGAFQTISKLGVIKSFSNVVLFNADGEIFSKYPDTLQCNIAPPKGLVAFQTFSGSELIIFEPINYNNENYGSLYVRISTQELSKQINDYVLLMLAIFIVAAILSYFLAVKLQKIISVPIESLTDFTALITETADYSLRIQPSGDDEIGKLYTDFNEMIHKIQQREQENETFKKQLKESEKKYSTLVENLTDGIFIIQNKHIVYANQRICSMMNKTEADIVGSKYLNYFNKKYWKSIEKTLNLINS